MSGYPDDDFNDREGRRREDDRDDRREDELDIRAAKDKVTIPAIGLILTAVISLLVAGYNLIQLPTIDKQFDDQIKQIENNQQLNANQKKEQVDLMNKFRDGMKVVTLPVAAVQALFAVITLVAGVKFMGLSSPGLVKLGAVFSFIPCLSGCCFLGLVFGIWALVVMGNPTVKAGFAARRRLDSSPDAY